MLARRFLLAAVAASGLAACATTAPERPVAAADPASARPGALYGLYLNGQAALLDGRNADAAGFFDAAIRNAPDDPVLRDRAFVAALLAGDIDKAAALAPPAAASPTVSSNQRLGRLVRAVQALADGKGAVAVAELSGEPIGFPHRAAAALIKPWAQAAAGDLAAATQPVEPGRDRVLAGFAEHNRALLLERARRYPEADAAFKALLDQAPGNDLLILSYGGYLERRNRRPEAVALYGAGLADDDSGNSELQSALTRAQGRRSPPPAPTLQQGAAMAMLAPAAALAAERQGELALAYLRLTLALDPKLDEAWLLVGDRLNEGRDRAGARAAYARVRAGTNEYATAQARLAFTYEQDGDSAQALQLTEAAARAAPNDRTVQLAYADVLRAAERHTEAAAVVSRLIGSDPAPDWRLLYLRGISLERAGDWPAAERDLQAALKARPEEPELLNYLGYAWIDRGERLDEAFAMIERAVALRPESGAIVDSLGWAHYRRGQYAEAVTQLERAVELEPADATVNDHLGDAYWRVGRRTEAQFQWRRALTLDPDAKLKTSVEAKLQTGLGPAGPAPATAVARP